MTVPWISPDAGFNKPPRIRRSTHSDQFRAELDQRDALRSPEHIRPNHGAPGSSRGTTAAFFRSNTNGFGRGLVSCS